MRIRKWWKSAPRDEAKTLREVQAQQAYADSEDEMRRAAEQAGEAHIVAASLRDLRKTNHFGKRMKLGIQHGLRD